MKFTHYCTCGASVVGEIRPNAKAALMENAFRRTHVGPGHAPCDRKTAANARRREERAEERRNR